MVESFRKSKIRGIFQRNPEYRVDPNDKWYLRPESGCSEHFPHAHLIFGTICGITLKTGWSMNGVGKWLVIASAIVTGSVFSETPVTLDQVVEMQKFSESQGWKDFVVIAKEKQWRAPVMPSLWHVERFSTGEVRQIHLASRELGRELVDQLAALPQKLNEHLTTEELVETADRLLYLSEWCGTTEGYGNFLLANRSLDLACIPLARLVTDLNVPTDRYAPLLKKLQPEWLRVEKRRRILNHEAGSELFPVSNKQDEDMEVVWGSGVVSRSERKHPGWKDRRKDDPLFDFVEERPAILANLDFFADDRSNAASPLTLINRWNNKHHYTLVVMKSSIHLAQEVSDLAEFRSVVGSFPTNAVPGAIRPGVEGAFYAAWTPTVKRLPGMSETEWSQRWKLAGRAWQLYDAVQRREVLDSESRTLKLQKLKDDIIGKTSEQPKP